MNLNTQQHLTRILTNTWSFLRTPPYFFTKQRSIQHEGKFTFSHYLMYVLWSWDSVVGIVTRLEGPRLEFRQGQEILLFSKTSRPPLGPTQSSIQWGPGLKTALYWVVTQRIVIIFTDVSEQSILPIFKGHRISRVKEFFTLEDGTDRLSRNVGKKLPLLAA